MKDANTLSTLKQRNYAMRRVLYNTLIAAKSLDSMSQVANDYSAKEMAKVSSLIMSRNLDDFFFKTDRDATRARQRRPTPNPQSSYKKPDDIFLIDFSLSWQPPTIAMISESDYERINKLVGHVVANPPKPFNDPEAHEIIKRLVRAATEFIVSCLASGRASYTGKAGFYVRRLNGTLEKIGIPLLPTPT